jgi:Domain of unknown function (DUF4188)
MARVDRRTVDLSAYPDLIVVYLGLRVNAITGIKKALGLGPQIAKSVADKPDGLLLHEDLLFSLFPPHLGMRQYWRDFESLERWTRSAPHRQWWKDFLRESGGTGFWHETYSIRGGIEAIYDDMPKPIGLMKFAPLSPARGSVFSARQRLSREGSESSPAPAPEADLYRE